MERRKLADIRKRLVSMHPRGSSFIASMSWCYVIPNSGQAPGEDVNEHAFSEHFAEVVPALTSSRVEGLQYCEGSPRRVDHCRYVQNLRDVLHSRALLTHVDCFDANEHSYGDPRSQSVRELRLERQQALVTCCQDSRK